MAEEFVDKHLALLELERTAEELQTQTYVSSQLLEDPKLLESKGVCIQKLQVYQCLVGPTTSQVHA